MQQTETQQQNKELKEYLEQEGISHDDIINQEIEQEHAENNSKKIEFKKMPQNVSDEMKKKLQDPNYFAMDLSFNINSMSFVDITEFNSQKLSPLEVDEKRKEYVTEKFTKLMLEVADSIQKIIQESGFIPLSIGMQANPFNEADYTSKCKLMDLLKVLDD